MDFEQLENFLVVAKYQHFSKAAEEICLSQSSLSKQIDRLEKEFCVKFFTRTTRRVHLTAAGREFCQYARNILNERERTKQQMRKYTALEEGCIILGSSSPLTNLLNLPAFMIAFQREYPGIELQLRESGSKNLLEWSRNSAIDAAILPVMEKEVLVRKFDLYPLLTDKLVIIAGKNHPLRQKKCISLAEVAKEKFIFMDRNSFAHAICLAACQQAGFEPEVIHESGYLDTIAGLVEGGLGISLVNSRIAVDLAAYHAMEVLRLKDACDVEVALLIRKDLRHIECIKCFTAFLLNWQKGIRPKRK